MQNGLVILVTQEKNKLCIQIALKKVFKRKNLNLKQVVRI